MIQIKSDEYQGVLEWYKLLKPEYEQKCRKEFINRNLTGDINQYKPLANDYTAASHAAKSLHSAVRNIYIEHYRSPMIHKILEELRLNNVHATVLRKDTDSLLYVAPSKELENIILERLGISEEEAGVRILMTSKHPSMDTSRLLNFYINKLYKRNCWNKNLIQVMNGYNSSDRIASTHHEGMTILYTIVPKSIEKLPEAFFSSTERINKYVEQLVG